MTAKDWPKIYQIADQMLERGEFNNVANLCLKISEDDPKQIRCWFLRSKAMQGLHDPKQAKHDILVALDLDPLKLEYFFQLCFVLIQANESHEIPVRIAKLWPHVPKNEKSKFIGFVETAIDSGMLNKLDLPNELLAEVLRHRNKSGD